MSSNTSEHSNEQLYEVAPADTPSRVVKARQLRREAVQLRYEVESFIAKNSHQRLVTPDLDDINHKLAIADAHDEFAKEIVSDVIREWQQQGGG